MCKTAIVERCFYPGAPLTYFNDGGGGRVIFLGLKFWPKVIFGVFEIRRDFCGLQKHNRDFLGCEKSGLRDFLGMLKKIVIFSGRQILKLRFFWV